MKPSAADSNAAPASTLAQQGSATSTAQRPPIPAAQRSEEARARQDRFVNDIELEFFGSGGNPVGAAERQRGRVDNAQRVIAHVDEMLAKSSGSNAAQEQPDDSRADDVRGAGGQFP